jgi:hypothetical protein
MKAIILLLAIGILTIPDQGKNPQSPQASRSDSRFDYATQIGIALRSEDRQLRLEIKNPNLSPHDEVVIVAPYGPQKIARASVVEKVSGHCSAEGFNDKGGDCYKLQAISGDVDGIATAFGIVKTPARFSLLKSGGVGADLDHDGVVEIFRACASMEGLHLTVWSGEPLKGKRRWHRYFYLGYDVEPNCQAGETEETPEK